MGLSRMAMLKYGVSGLAPFLRGMTAVFATVFNELGTNHEDLVELAAGTGRATGRRRSRGLWPRRDRPGTGRSKAASPKGRELGGVLVAEVLDIKPHPNANKLRIVRVRAGLREESVVCGAPQTCHHRQSRVLGSARGAPARRAHPGCARNPGVVLAWMICSEIEMGLSEQAKGS